MEASPSIDRAQDKASLTKNIAALSGSQFVTALTSIVAAVLIPRALGASWMGVYATAASVTAIAALVGAPITSDYLVLDMVRHKDRAPRLAASGLLLRAAAVPAFVAFIYIYTHVAGLAVRAQLVFYIMTISVIAGMFLDVVQSGFRSTERMEYLGASNMLLAVATDVILVVTVILGGGIIPLVTATALIALAVLFINARWALKLKQLAFRTDRRDLYSLTVGGLPYWPKQLAMVIYVYIDVVLLSAMASPNVVGWYGLAGGILGALLFLPMIFCTAWYPRLIAAYEDSPGALRMQVKPLLGLVPTLSIPIAVACAVGASPYIRLVYGPDYVRAIPVMVVLGFCTIPMYTGICLGMVLQAMRRPMMITVLLFGGIVVNVCLNLVLIPMFSDRYSNGALGAAVSLLITEVLITSGMLVVIGRSLLDLSVFRRLPGVLIASAVMFAINRVSAPLGLASLALAGFAFTITAIPLRVVTPDERTAIRGTLARHILGRRRRLPATAVASQE
jgi:O-antigen/teichoic acid export membrane protein